MTLAELPLNALAVVARVTGEPALRERLTELGFTPGSQVKVSRRAPLGDPIHVEVRGAGFAVRKDQARRIELEDARP